MQAVKFTSIKKELTVEASQRTAFEVFTEKMDLWWPKTHHVGSCPMQEMVLEGRSGGRWYSKHEDGSEVNIGYILSWQPYEQLILAWQINGNFQYDPELITEVSVQFIAEGATTTTIRMEHKDLDKLGGGKAIESMDQGWGMIMGLYKKETETVDYHAQLVVRTSIDKGLPGEGIHAWLDINGIIYKGKIYARNQIATEISGDLLLLDVHRTNAEQILSAYAARPFMGETGQIKGQYYMLMKNEPGLLERLQEFATAAIA